MSALILTLLVGTSGFTIYCNTSKEGLCCVFMQNDKVVAYTYRLHEKCHPTHDLKFVTIVFTLKIWR